MRLVDRRSSVRPKRSLRERIIDGLNHFGRWAEDFERRERARFYGKRPETLARKAPINNRVARRRIAREKRTK